VINFESLPANILTPLTPLFDRISPDTAMEQLVVTQGADEEICELVENIITENTIFLKFAPLKAGLWLYVDELDRSHQVSQGIDDSTGSFWHGIMHRREGDFSNSHYWFRRAGFHPVIEQIPEYEPHEFIDAVAEGRNGNRNALRDLQRSEWITLFSWCANIASK